MSTDDYFLPFSTAWISSSLYRTVSESAAGRIVQVDGWNEAMDTAWRQLVDSLPVGSTWVKDYRAAMVASSLCVTFNDVTRVVARRGNGGFGVSYPADLLLDGDDKLAAMRKALLTALDRHVDRCELDVPLLSEVVRGA